MSSKKNLLIITQKVDQNDTLLGFMHGWIIEFAANFKKITVICLQKGEYSLPSNVEVLSLGKELGAYKVEYIFNFYRYIFSRRKQYDAVFVHMNPEYVLLGGIFWRLWGKKIVLWYNHTFGNWKCRFAMKIVNVVCHTSPYAFTARTKKSLQMPAGIPTEIFKFGGLKTTKPSILYVGRIAPVKDLATIIGAVKILHTEKIDFTLNIYGEALPRYKKYEEEIKKEAHDLIDKGLIFFKGSIPNRETPKVFSESWVFVNLTPSGNYDKTVLEAMACESIPVASSRAFAEILPANLIFKEKDPVDLAEKIKNILAFGVQDREKIGKEMRNTVEKRESLNKLTSKIVEIFN
ncbi:MAG: glycosyltransferase family 4 protein [Patescibacteria group bacterium]